MDGLIPIPVPETCYLISLLNSKNGFWDTNSADLNILLEEITEDISSSNL